MCTVGKRQAAQVMILFGPLSSGEQRKGFPRLQNKSVFMVNRIRQSKTGRRFHLRPRNGQLDSGIHCV